jgi:branched-chain amino acid transport system permease protein
MAHAAFFAAGAYASALCATRLAVPFPLDVVIGALVAVTMSLVVSFAARRLQGDYLVLCTFGLQMIVANVLSNWISLTRGAAGISGISAPHIAGLAIDSPGKWVIVSFIAAAICWSVAARIGASPLGRALRAIREDDLLAQSIGKNPFALRVTALAVSAALAAAAGSMYARFATFVDPSTFTATESILIVSMVLIGGSDSRWGPVLGAAFLVCFPELLRSLGLSSTASFNLRQVAYGALLIAIVRFRPRGVVGRYTFVQ